MSEEAPKPTLEESLKRLRNLEEFHVVCDFLHGEREAALASMYDAPDANQAMKLAGILSGYQNVLSLLKES